MKSIRVVLAALRRADHEFGLIKQNDKIMVGVSGGKDSLVLCYALKLYQQFPHTNFTFQPVILDLGFPNSNYDKLVDYFKTLGLDLMVADAQEVFPILSAHKNAQGLLPCSICSRMKKAAINKVAHDLGYHKVAFAHHADDAIETLFLNEIYGGKIATFSPYMHLENADIDFIRPLIYARESEIAKCAEELELPIYKSTCPNDKLTMRQTIKNAINEIYHQYPFSKQNFLNMLTNYEHLDIWTDKLNCQIEQTNLSFSLATTKSDLANALNMYPQNHKKIPENLEQDFYLLKDNNVLIGACTCKANKDNITIQDICLFKSHKDKKEIFISNLIKHLKKKYPDAIVQII